MGMMSGWEGAIGPALVILIIYILYWKAQDIDARPAKLKADSHIREVDAESRLEELKLKRDMIDFELKRLNRLSLDHDKTTVDSQYKILEDQREDQE